MPDPTVKQMIADLKLARYAGRGGNAALAAELDIHPQSLKQWAAGKTMPTYAHRQLLLALWRDTCGGDA